MRILMVNQYAVEPGYPGGTRHYSLCRELIRRGHDVKLIATSFNHATRSDTRLRHDEIWREELCGEVPFLWCRSPNYKGNTAGRLWNMLVFAFRVWRGIGWKKRWKPDIVIGSNPQLFAALASERIASRLGVPFVMEIRDLWPQTFIDMGAMSPRHPLSLCFAVIERHVYHRAQAIISLLPLAAEHVAKKGEDASKVVWIPNGIDIDMLPAPRPPPDDNVFTVMYTGSHSKSDDLDTLLNTAELLSRDPRASTIRFVLIGDGPEKGNLQARVANANLNNVLFRGPVPKSELFNVMNEADAFIVMVKDMPIYRYGASFNKFFDYLAMARPTVMAANIPRNPFLESGSGICVGPSDSVALAEACLVLAKMPSIQRQSMGTAGRKFVEEHHSMTLLAARLEGVLLDAMKYTSFKETL